MSPRISIPHNLCVVLNITLVVVIVVIIVGILVDHITYVMARIGLSLSSFWSLF